MVDSLAKHSYFFPILLVDLKPSVVGEGRPKGSVVTNFSGLNASSSFGGYFCFYIGWFYALNFNGSMKSNHNSPMGANRNRGVM